MNIKVIGRKINYFLQLFFLYQLQNISSYPPVIFIFDPVTNEAVSLQARNLIACATSSALPIRLSGSLWRSPSNICKAFYILIRQISIHKISTCCFLSGVQPAVSKIGVSIAAGLNINIRWSHYKFYSNWRVLKFSAFPGEW